MKPVSAMPRFPVLLPLLVGIFASTARTSSPADSTVVPVSVFEPEIAASAAETDTAPKALTPPVPDSGRSPSIAIPQAPDSAAPGAGSDRSSADTASVPPAGLPPSADLPLVAAPDSQSVPVPVAIAPARRDSVEVVPTSRDRGGLESKRPVRPGRLSVQLGCAWESWVGTYKEGAVLIGNPVGEQADLRLRWGIVGLGEAGVAELGLDGAYGRGNDDAGGGSGLFRTTASLTLAPTRWLAVRGLLAPPWGSRDWTGRGAKWWSGTGLLLSPGTPRFHVDLDAAWFPTPNLIDASLEPWWSPFDAVAIRLAGRARIFTSDIEPQALPEGFHALHPGKGTARLFSVEPGGRIRLGRAVSLGFGAPFTVSGYQTVGFWSVEGDLRLDLGA